MTNSPRDLRMDVSDFFEDLFEKQPSIRRRRSDLRTRYSEVRHETDSPAYDASDRDRMAWSMNPRSIYRTETLEIFTPRGVILVTQEVSVMVTGVLLSLTVALPEYVLTAQWGTAAGKRMPMKTVDRTKSPADWTTLLGTPLDGLLSDPG